MSERVSEGGRKREQRRNSIQSSLTVHLIDATEPAHSNFNITSMLHNLL